MLCSMIDALVGREVITINIKGAFLTAHVAKDLDLIVKMDGDLARAFCELNPNFVRKGEGTLYLRCLKALYGHIEAARLFYNELDYSLMKQLGFTRNKYDLCVYNQKGEDGSITTIKTHVDDLKVSLKSNEQLQRVVGELKDIYNEITVHEGSTHDFLGMIIVAKRARSDILLAVSFLTTRVEEPDVDDWGKLLPVSGYLNETLKYHFTLFCSGLNNLTWYIDGSYASHSDMRGQSGAKLVAGNYSVHFRSNKQKVNTRSSTETELIAVDDALPTVQWTKHFMMKQGYNLET